MGDSPVYDFKVRSTIRDYQVMFVEKVAPALQSELCNDDLIIIDRKIKDLYPDLLNGNPKFIALDAHEYQKSLEGLIPVIHKLIGNGFQRTHRLVAIGGGVIQDVTGFIASVIYRGVDWIYLPTTLLAQGDSCIGSKTSINFGEFKNQLGGYYPPNKILIAPEFLATLSKVDIDSGLGEMSHYFVAAGEDDFNQYRRDYETSTSDPDVFRRMIARSLQIKKRYVEADEFDRGERQLLNYGHSFAHAIESQTNYEVPHGIAVSYGMDMANFVSVKRGYLSTDIRYEIRGLLEKIWTGYQIPHVSADQVLLGLSKDKKNVGKELRLILCKGYGNLFKAAQNIDKEFRDWIQEYFERELN